MAFPANLPPTDSNIPSIPKLASYTTLDDLVPEKGVAVFDLLDFCKLENTNLRVDLATRKIQTWREFSSNITSNDPRAQYPYLIVQLGQGHQPIFLSLQRRRFESTPVETEIPPDVVSRTLD